MDLVGAIALGILVNVYVIMRLSTLTLVRLLVWMIIGMSTRILADK
jgi:hypothetical protein